MDLRKFNLSQQDLEQAKEFIKSGHLQYQPFIFSDTLEVGEGQNLFDKYKHGHFVNHVYSDQDLGLGQAQATDLTWFRKCNAGFRALYEHFADEIVRQFKGDISDISFGEIGCNNGLNLFNMATRGAKSCLGFDWNEMGEYILPG